MNTSNPMNIRPPIIAIFGQKENGKTTLANMIYNRLKEAYIIISQKWVWELRRPEGFADPIYQTLSHMLGISVEEIKKDKARYRTFLQKLGELGREINPMLWVNMKMRHQYPLLIDDGRYFNEANTVMFNRGFVIFIVRPSRINIDPHSSESEILHVRKYYRDHFYNNLHVIEVTNDCSLDILESNVRMIIVPKIIDWFDSIKE